MRVLHLTSGNLFGGIESYLLTLARMRGLCPAMEPHFGLCFPGRLRDDLTAAGVPVHDLGSVRVSRPWTVMLARRRLKAVLREERIEAVVTHGTWPHAIFGAAVKRVGIRLVNAVHGTPTRRHWLDRWAARTRPDAVVANSRFTAGPASDLFRMPASVLHCPVAPASAVDSSARAAIRRELGASPDDAVILQASRLEAWKGQGELIRALGELAGIPHWQVWFAGGPQRASEGAYLLELEGAARSSGIAERVKFLGQRTDVRGLMGAADIYCQPNSAPEPFGIALVEALAAGLPVISTRFGGALEIVDESCGVLVPPGDCSALAAALQSLIADPRRRRKLGDSGPARAAALCDPARQLSRFSELIAGIAPARVSR